MVNMITALCGYFSGTFVSDTGGTFKSDTPGTFVSDIGGTFEVILSLLFHFPNLKCICLYIHSTNSVHYNFHYLLKLQCFLKPTS